MLHARLQLGSLYGIAQLSQPEDWHTCSQDGVEDLIHDEGEELHGDEEDVVPRLEREAAFRQAAPRDDLSPEELEKFVNERYKARAADLDVGQDVATSECFCPSSHACLRHTPFASQHSCGIALEVHEDEAAWAGNVGQQGLLPRHATLKSWILRCALASVSLK